MPCNILRSVNQLRSALCHHRSLLNVQLQLCEPNVKKIMSEVDEAEVLALLFVKGSKSVQLATARSLTHAVQFDVNAMRGDVKCPHIWQQALRPAFAC